MDGNGTEEPVLYRDGVWFVSGNHDGVVDFDVLSSAARPAMSR